MPRANAVLDVLADHPRALLIPATEQIAAGVRAGQRLAVARSVAVLDSSPENHRLEESNVFNNLVIFDQHVSQNSLQSIIPELGLDLPPTQQL
jgi:hypothetical protein